MASLTIRQLDDAVYERLKRDAIANHRSIEAEARVRLGQPVASTEDWAERSRRAAVSLGPDYEGSVALIRAVRDEE